MPFRFPLVPRHVVRRKGIPVPVRCLLFLLIPHTWVGIAFLVAAVWVPAAIVFGHTSTATVIDRQVRRSKGTHYYVKYAYEEAGRHFTDTAEVDPQPFATAYPLQASIPIRSLHVRGHGTSTVLAPGTRRTSFLCMTPFALFWNGIVFFMFYSLCLSPLKQRSLLHTGEVAHGVISGKQEHHGKSATYSVLYSFDAVDHPMLGQMTVSPAEYAFAKEGDGVAVLYDPGCPSRSIIYKYSQYAVRDEHGFEVNG
jgi:hypothetical protein